MLQTKLNAEYVCDAVAGCSNDSIIERTLKYLETNTPDLMIIGWSTWERETWFWNNANLIILHLAEPIQCIPCYKNFIKNG
jgi:hypothetical protein